MEASKVSFSSETRLKLQSPVLDYKKKKQLRIQRVCEYIKSKPSGTRFRMLELMEAAGYNAQDQREYSSGHSFLKGLHKRGVLNIEDTPSYNKIVYVLNSDDVITKKIADETSEDDIDTPSKPTVDEVPGENTQPKVTEILAKDETTSIEDINFIRKVEKLAQKFSWEKDSDSLREFIKFLK